AAEIRPVTRAGADQRAGERGGEGNFPGRRIGLVVTDDIDGPVLPVQAEGYAAAERGFVSGRRRGQFGRGEAGAPVAQASLRIGERERVRLRRDPRLQL